MIDIKIEDNLEQATQELAVALSELSVEGSQHIRDSQSYVILQKHGTNCNIEARYNPKPRTEVLDEYGNEFMQMELTVIATYPSHGGAEVVVALDRVQFLMEVCLAAIKLRNAFMARKVYWLRKSAASKQKQLHEASAEVVRKAIIINCKGIRVGQVKKFCDGTFSDQLVSGVYQIDIDKKSYTADVSNSKVVTVIRNAAPPTEVEK